MTEPALAMATGMFTGRLAATTHAYPSSSYGIQLTAAQFFQDAAGRRADRVGHGSRRSPPAVVNPRFRRPTRSDSAG